MSLRATLALTAGGTGGHVFPALALAEELERRGHAIAFITDERGGGFGDTRSGITVHHISAGRLGPGLTGKARGLARLAIGFLQAQRLLKRVAPKAMVGFGSYASVPAMVAATRSGVPTLIHEQNAVLGRANRLVAGRVARIATSFERVDGVREGEGEKVVRTGNPVRPAIAALGAQPYPSPAEPPIRILVLGGSQGATVFSRIVPAAVAQLPASLRSRLAIAQQCRAADLEAARAAYAKLALPVDLETFFADVPVRLAHTHLMISRSGASTVAEVTAAGRPAILVPYPHATDDHQTANARALADVGAAWHIPDDADAANKLAATLQTLLAQPDMLARAAEAARGAGTPDAAARLADQVERLAGVGPAAASGNHGTCCEAAA
jgi:UDP-N-acetylglucosamine--N-acetylmuramyl-(pentapeptide) pyrophosphoryl-undecaprenol N-acetylglucosamine transferase